MAEKSSELEKLNKTDALSTDVTNDDVYLEKRADDDSLTDAEPISDESTDDADEIREQIVETRRGMSETIDAIQEKLSFSNISEQVKDQVSEQFGSVVESVKDATIQKAEDVMQVINKGMNNIAASDAFKVAKQNPWILSLIGIGVGALLVNNLTSGKKKKRSSYRYDNEQNFNDDDEVRFTDNSKRELKSSETEPSTVQTTRNKVGDAASSAYESVSGAASSAFEAVSGAAGTTYETVGSAAGKSYEGVSKAAGFAYDKAGDLGGQVKINYDYYIEENPLAVGAVALALGAAVGFAIPLTKTENEYLGEYRDNVLEKAQATAQDAIGTVKQMAGEAQKAIVSEVKSQTA